MDGGTCPGILPSSFPIVCRSCKLTLGGRQVFESPPRAASPAWSVPHRKASLSLSSVATEALPRTIPVNHRDADFAPWADKQADAIQTPRRERIFLGTRAAV